ncbi:MAG: hypothetical protein ACRCVT_11180 [Leadbetterella sp.]
MPFSVCTTPRVDFYTEIFHSLSDIDDRWDLHLPAGHHMNRKNLSFYENAAKISPKYLLINSKTEGGLVAIVYLQVIEVNLNTLGSKALRVIQKLGSIVSDRFKLKCVIVGNVFSASSHGILILKDEYKIDVYDQVREIVSQAVEGFDAIMLKDIPKGILNSNFYPFDGDFTMQLSIDPSWTSVGEYEKSLAKKYAKRFTKVQAVFQRLTRIKVDLEFYHTYKSEIHSLFNQVLSRQNTRVGEYSENYFRTVIEQEGYEMYGFLEGERILSFCVLQDNVDGVLTIPVVGFDYQENTEKSLYLGMLNFALEYAIQSKSRFLNLGRTALTAKSSLGAQPVYTQHQYYFENPLLTYIFSKSVDRLFERQEFESRSPFK